MKKLRMIACTVGIGAMFALPLLAADAGTEIKTAATHAGLAAKATDVKTVQTHLHHTLNCLEGPSGADFDKAEMNPCSKDGNGALPDATAAQKKSIEGAIAKAKSGIAATDLKAAQKDAMATADELNKIK